MGFKGNALKRRAAATKTHNRSASLTRHLQGKFIAANKVITNELPKALP